MITPIAIWNRRGTLSYRPDPNGSEPVLIILTARRDVTIDREAERLHFTPLGGEGLTPSELALAARCRWFRLRTWDDRLTATLRRRLRRAGKGGASC